MRCVVVTTLDPQIDPDHQRRCIRAWCDLGFVVRLAQTARDTKAVQRAGLPPELGWAIPARETALDRHGAPAPMVVPLLHRVTEVYPGHAVLIVAPGVFPAMRNSDCVAQWMGIAPALGLIAEETPLLDITRFSQSRPHHGQVDAVLLRADHIQRLAGQLTKTAPALDMCLGDAGWDLMLAATLARPPLRGALIHAGVLLREVGGRTPRHGLLPYVPALRAMRLAEAPDAHSAAQDCAESIAALCATHQDHSTRIKAFYFQTPPHAAPLAPQDRDQAQTWLALLPWIRWNYDIEVLGALAQRLRTPATFDSASLTAALRTGPSLDHQISQTLFAMVIWSECRPAPLATGTAPLPDLDPASRTQAHLGLITHLATEMIDHDRLASRHDEILALICQNDGDRLLAQRILYATRKVAHAA